MVTTPAIGRIVYFGDSLTDSGIYYGLATQTLAFPVPSYVYGYDGKFSNGDVYADIAPELMGLQAGDVANYAAGGARAGSSWTFEQSIYANGTDPFLVASPPDEALSFDLSLIPQVQRFLADAAVSGVPANTAASIFIGLDDFGNFTPSSPETAPDEAAALIQQMLTSIVTAGAALAQAGVSEVILNTLPPVSIFPLFQYADPVLQALGDQAVAAFNQGLAAGAAQLEGLGVNVEIVRMDAITNEVWADPSTFGFLNLTDSKFLFTGANPINVGTPDNPVPYAPENPAVAGMDPGQLAWYDLQHPTTALQGVLGAFTEASLTSELSLLTDGADKFKGGSGSYLVLAGDGADKIRAGSGSSVVLAGLGDDRAQGSNGSDILSGGSGNDRLSGARGSDILAGGAGDDTMYGGAGDDAFFSGLGFDGAFGGAGNDLFFFTEASLIGGTGLSGAFIKGGSGQDTLYLRLSDETRAAVEAELAASHANGIVRLESIGIVAAGVEQFLFLDDSGIPDDATTNTVLAGLLNEADQWGFV